MLIINPEVIAREIQDWPGYAVGKDWRIWSRWTSKGPGSRLGIAWRPMADRPGRTGYRRVTLCRSNERREAYVHVLILEVFVGPCPDGLQARHLDDDKTNNNPSNLCWGTHRENTDDKVRNDRVPKGTNHANSKLTEADIIEIRRLYAAGKSQPRIAAMFSINRSRVGSIVRRQGWKHIP